MTAALTVLAAAATAGLILYLGRALMAPPGAERAAHQATALEDLPVLWPVPEFDYANHRGTNTSRANLLGKPWVANFFFTTCTTVCPRLTANTVALQRKLADEDVRFVSFSVDPERDSVEVLKAYAERWGADERWLLLQPGPAHVRELAAGMRVVVEASDDPVNPIVHTSMFFLVDASGDVRGVYDSNDDAALARLVRDVGDLLDPGDAPTDPPSSLATVRGTGSHATADGKYLYEALGCGACHDDERLAPMLKSMLGARRHLEDGSQVVVDRDYIRQSIVAPGEKIVQGYLPLMPSYRAHLDDSQLEALVDFVVRESGAVAGASPQEPPVDVVNDVVCNMQVRVVEGTPHVRHAGHDYYFCAESCRKRFAADPSRFLDAGLP